MQLDVISKSRRKVSLTSLIDVIFLLLLFFMLSSTFSKYSQVEVVSGKSGATATNHKPDVFINLDGQGLKLNGVDIELSTLLIDIKNTTSSENIKAILKIGSFATSQQLIDVVEKLNSGDIKVTVIE